MSNKVDCNVYTSRPYVVHIRLTPHTKFPRLRSPDAVKQTISRGVEAGMMAYVVKEPSGKYEPFVFRQELGEGELEVAEDVFLITKDAAEAYLAGRELDEEPAPAPGPATPEPGGGDGRGGTTVAPTPPATPTTPDLVRGFRWVGEITPQKWMNFYTKVLARFAAAKGLTLSLTVDVQPEGGVSKAKITEMKVALRELGMSEDVRIGDTHDSGRTE